MKSKLFAGAFGIALLSLIALEAREALAEGGVGRSRDLGTGEVLRGWIEDSEAALIGGAERGPFTGNSFEHDMTMLALVLLHGDNNRPQSRELQQDFGASSSSEAAQDVEMEPTFTKGLTLALPLEAADSDGEQAAQTERPPLKHFRTVVAINVVDNTVRDALRSAVVAMVADGWEAWGLYNQWNNPSPEDPAAASAVTGPSSLPNHTLPGHNDNGFFHLSF
ncbi:MAG: hypothetical protein AAF530_15370 [Pseudomonadota bacterium]